MRLRTFTAPDMPAAMKLVREALGDDAIILSSESARGRKSVKVTAAVEEEPMTDGGRRQEKKIIPSSSIIRPPLAAEPLRFQLQETLRFHNLPELFIAKLLQKEVSGRSLRSALEHSLEAFYAFSPLAIRESKSKVRHVLMLVGPPGIGKTLTIAKMAASLALNHQEVTVITTDNKRAGGIEQLQAFTDILKLTLHVAAGRAELAKHLKASHGQVLIDTAGCNPYDAGEMKELQSCAVLPGIEPVLVLPAGGDSLEAIDMVEPFMAMPIKRLLVTRSDTARRFGGVLAAAAAHELAFCNVSDSSSIREKLQPVSGALLARLLLKHQQ
ncbi:MAG: GTPase [Pseudomonadota bacterium]|nr:GTPase [Pseudomonadota bacterium]